MEKTEKSDRIHRIVICTLAVIAVGVLVFLAIYATAKDVTTEYATFEGYFYEGDFSQPVTDKTDALSPSSRIYTFTLRDSSTVAYTIHNEDNRLFKDATQFSAEEGAYEIQNRLKIGESYILTLKDNVIIGARAIKETQSVENGLVSYTPGERTLKNFLRVSLAPVGQTLIIYGGGWDFQDIGAGNEARTIGVDSVWKKEFEAQDENYSWLEDYPHYGWNKDHSRGFDNCGYVGWALYNALYDTSLTHEGLVFHPEILSEYLTQKYNYGTDILPDLQGKTATEIARLLKPGDIIGSSLHSRIVIGTCLDGSVVLADCCSAISKTGAEGGGVQLIALNSSDDGNKDCDAYRLVQKYMSEQCPAWTERYEAKMGSTEVCFNLVSAVRMDFENGVFTDLEGYSNMSAEEILTRIFTEGKDK